MLGKSTFYNEAFASNKTVLIHFYRCRIYTTIDTFVAVQSSVRSGWWQQLNAPTGELILPTIKGFIFDLSIAYHVKCKIIPVQASTEPVGSGTLRLPDFETIAKWK